MRVEEVYGLLGDKVLATCTDGGKYSGVLCSYQSFAEEPDEPETIGIAEVPGFITEIPLEEVSSIEAMA